MSVCQPCNLFGIFTEKSVCLTLLLSLAANEKTKNKNSNFFKSKEMDSTLQDFCQRGIISVW